VLCAAAQWPAFGSAASNPYLSFDVPAYEGGQGLQIIPDMAVFAGEHNCPFWSST